MNILVNASVLGKIIEAEPHVKVDLMNKALPQLATLLARIFTEEGVERKINESIRSIMSSIQYGNMTTAQVEGIKKIILTIWQKDMKARLEIEALRIAEEIAEAKIADMLEAVRSEIAEARTSAQSEIEAYARQVAEREIMLLLRNVRTVPAD